MNRNRIIHISCWVVMAAALFSVRPALGQYEGLVINEILANPRNTSGVELDSNADGEFSVFDDEFIELMNTSASQIDMSGCWLTDLKTNIQLHVFSPRLLPPGGSIVVFGGGSLLSFSNPPAQIATGGSLSLNNNADETVYLFSPQTTVVDQVSFRLTASHDAISLVRDPAGTGGFTNHYQATTNAARMSPGRQLNGQAFLTNQPPVLLDIADQTAFVGQELDVTVRAYDPADGDPITLSVVNNPSNSMLSSTGGVGTFTFTPTEDQAGLDLQLLFIAGDVDGAETNIVSFQIINHNADEDIWINEIHYNNISDDVDEGVEIAGTAGSMLSEYSLILYNGLNGNTYNSNALTGTLDDDQCGFGATWIDYPQNGLQNETEGIALVKGTNVLQFLSYDGVITAANGPAQGMTSIDIGVKETVTTPLGYSLQLEGTGTVYSAFTWANAQPHSRGTLNSNQTIVCLSPPSIEIQKTVYLGQDGGTGGPGVESVQGTNGAPLTYLFLVSNTGGTSLTNVMVLDAALGIPPIELGTLVTGQISTSYVEGVLSGDLRNTATVSGEDPDGLSVTDQDTAEVVEIIPSINIQKTVYRGHDGGAGCPGSDFLLATNATPVTYCFIVENNGNTNLTSVTLTDASLGISTLIGTLEAGGTFSTSVEAVVTGSLTNTAIVDGIDPNTDPVSDQDTAIVTVISPALQLEKSVYLGHDSGASIPGSEQVSGDSGTAITYCFQLSNTGDTALTNVVLSDAGLTGFTEQNLGTMATGETASLYYETTVTASFLNTATATAFSVIGSLVTDADSAEVELTTPVVTNWNLEYEVIDLGTLGGAVSEAKGVNDRGEVVGASIDSNGNQQAFHWQNGTMSGLGFLPGGTSSMAYAINDSGAISGKSYVSGTEYHAFLTTSNGLYDIGTLGGAHSVGLAINNHCEVTGLAWVPSYPPIWYEPFWWRTNQMIGISPWDRELTAEGRGINDESRIAGFTILDIPAADRAWAMVWHDDNDNGQDDLSGETDSEMKVLGTLGGEWSQANAINNSNQVVGWASLFIDSFNPVHAFLITPSNGFWKLPVYKEDALNLLMLDLGALENPANNSYAHALNDQALVVGTSTSTSGVNQAFLWRDGIMTNLNDLIAANSPWVLTNATGINNFNEICGTGLYQGQKRAFLLRQGGRISKITSLMVPNGLSIFTNEFGIVTTQQLERVDTQVIEWVGTWSTNTTAAVDFTVEYCEPLQDHTWAPAPSNEWPITETFWTNHAYDANRMRFFRVKAQEQVLP